MAPGVAYLSFQMSIHLLGCRLTFIIYYHIAFHDFYVMFPTFSLSLSSPSVYGTVSVPVVLFIAGAESNLSMSLFVPFIYSSLCFYSFMYRMVWLSACCIGYFCIPLTSTLRLYFSLCRSNKASVLFHYTELCDNISFFII